MHMRLLLLAGLKTIDSLPDTFASHFEINT
jgi:hypothetical protein